ncbi:restriction endonuclease subunit S [Vibrio cholerae]
MVSEWKDAKLGDYIDSCLGKMLDKNKNTGEFHPYLGNSNVRWGAFELDELSEMKFESHEHERYGIKKGDLIVCEGGEPGRCAIWNEDVPDMKIQKALHRVRTLAGLDGDYLYYWFLFSARAGHIDPYFTGTTIKHLTGKALKELPIKIPPMRYQQEAAKLLRGFDNKITLNRQINQTLEQMAQTLFKSWFVDFDPVMDNALDAGNPIPDELQHRAEARNTVRESEGFKPLPDDVRQLFPDAFEESELGWVPKGWEVKKISDFGSVICGKTPSKKIPEYYGSDVPFLKIPDMHGNVFVVKTTDKLSYKGSNSQVKKLIPKDSISVSCIATVGLVSISTEPMHTNQQINSIVPNQPRFRDYLYFSMKEKRKQFHDLASGGSTTLNMNTGVFSRVSVLKPSDAILDMFQTQSSGLLERIKLSSTESESLAALRDTLLPKLISGELRLDDIELAVEQEAVSAEQQNER